MPTPQVVGGVVGGLAGLSLILIAALLFLRWYKKKQQAATNAIAGAGAGAGGPAPPETSQNPDSAAAVAAAVPAGGFLRRLSRPRQIQPPPPEQRGFERVAGRKLPSQFSPGMEGPSGPTTSSAAGPAAGATAAGAGATGAAGAAGMSYPSDSSSYYPSGGTWLSTGSADNPFQDPSRSPVLASGAAAAASARQEAASPSERERFMPGPARTPTLHQGETSRTSHLAHLQAPMPSFSGSPPSRGITPPPAAGPGRPPLNRSPASYDSSRGSRFQEDFAS